MRRRDQKMYGSDARVYQLRFLVRPNRKTIIDAVYSYNTIRYDYRQDIYLPDVLPADQSFEDMLERELKEMKFVMPTKDSKVYFTKDCSISRRKFTEQFHTVRKIEDADIVVIPDDNSATKYTVHTMAIAMFTDGKDYLWFTPKNINISDAPGVFPLIGDSLLDYITNHTDVLQKAIMTDFVKYEYSTFKCCFSGFAIFYDRGSEWKIDISRYPDKFYIKESSLNILLKNEYTVINSFNIKGVIDNINSPDKATRIYGLRTLAQLDYGEHPYILWYIKMKYNRLIDECGQLPRDVKFMFKCLDAYKYYMRKPTKFDADVLCDYFLKDFTDRINREIKITETEYGYNINDYLTIHLTPNNYEVEIKM